MCKTKMRHLIRDKRSISLTMINKNILENDINFTVEIKSTIKKINKHTLKSFNYPIKLDSN